MNKAKKQALNDMKTKKGYNNYHDDRWYWRIRGYSELIFYWLNAFNWLIALMVWWVTGDFWKGLGLLTLFFFYNLNQNIRGLFLHIEQLIEWTIDKTI